MKNFIAGAILLLGLIFVPNVGEAATCGERSNIINHLYDRFGEIRVGIGLASNNGVVEVFASPETGSWTIFVTMPNGKSCLIASGEHWEDNPEKVKKESF